MDEVGLLAETVAASIAEIAHEPVYPADGPDHPVGLPEFAADALHALWILPQDLGPRILLRQDRADQNDISKVDVLEFLDHSSD